MYYYIKDNNYSVVSIIDENTTVVESYSYTPYGKMSIKDQNGHDILKSKFNNTITYTGRRVDSESGLFYYRNRMYSSELGRFLSKDPKGYVDGSNLYAYVMNNPVRYLDPMGTKHVDKQKSDLDILLSLDKNKDNNIIDIKDATLAKVNSTYNNVDKLVTVHASANVSTWMGGAEVQIGYYSNGKRGGLYMAGGYAYGRDVGLDVAGTVYDSPDTKQLSGEFHSAVTSLGAFEAGAVFNNKNEVIGKTAGGSLGPPQYGIGHVTTGWSFRIIEHDVIPLNEIPLSP